MNIEAEDHPFMVFAMQESAQLESTGWLAWVKRAEACLGHDLIGDLDKCGISEAEPGSASLNLWTSVPEPTPVYFWSNLK